MKRLTPFHHYNVALHRIDDPVELLEERVVQLLLHASVKDGSRDSSVAFELKHSAGVLQFGRLLARKRGLPPHSAAVGALLHDIYVIVEGRYKDHAHLGAPIARGLMEEIGGFTEDEQQEVEMIVFHHSDKHVFSDNALAELGKDADVLDCFLYPGAFDYYLLAKPLDGFAHYLTRGKRIWSELQLPADPAFTVLDTYVPNEWLSRSIALSSPPVHSSEQPPAPFAVVLHQDSAEVFLPEGTPFTRAVQSLAHSAMREASEDTNGAGDVLLVWPAIERWQSLSWHSDAQRLADLGLSVLDPAR